MTDQTPDLGKHPRGTLALIIAYGVVFVMLPLFTNLNESRPVPERVTS